VRKGDFRKVFEQGSKFSSRHLVIYAKANGLNFSRLGLAVSRKIGSAVVRNRIRRRLREAMKMELRENPLRYDFIIVARNASAEAEFSNLRKFIHRVLSGLVNENNLDRAD
jgi:ribonuclease P protein component